MPSERALKMLSFDSNITWGRWRAYLRALEQKMGEPLGVAIFDENHQYLYQNNQSMILQRLVGVSKQYRKYFRFRAINHFSIFHPFFKCIFNFLTVFLCRKWLTLRSKKSLRSQTIMLGKGRLEGTSEEFQKIRYTGQNVLSHQFVSSLLVY